MRKKIDPLRHIKNDYIFSGIQFILPSILGVNTVATGTYRLLGAKQLLISALTASGKELFPLFSFKRHQQFDASAIAALGALTFSPMIRKDKAALCFHLLFLGAALLNYYATDYDIEQRDESGAVLAS